MPENRRGLLLVMMEPDEGYEELLNRWYDEEHLAERLQVPGFLSARRFVAVEGSPKYLALYELESPDVLRTPDYLDRKNDPTPMTVEVESHVRMRRNVYLEITPT